MNKKIHLIGFYVGSFLANTSIASAEEFNEREGYLYQVHISSIPPQKNNNRFHLVTSGNGHQVQLWKPNDNDVERSLLMTLQSDAFAGEATFSPDGSKIVVGSQNGTIQCWDAATGAPLLRIASDGESISTVQFSNNGKQILTLGSDLTIKVWDSSTGKRLYSFGKSNIHGSFSENDPENILMGYFSQDGKQVIAVSDYTITLLDGLTGQIVSQQYTEGKLLSAVLSPNASLLLLTYLDRNEIELLSMKNEDRWLMYGHTALVVDATFSPDGSRIATASRDGTIRIWDAQQAQEVRVLSQEAPLLSVQFSHDGDTLIAGGENNEARIWNMRTGELLQKLIGHKDHVVTVHFSPNDQQAVTTSWDYTTRIWDSKTGQLLKTLPSP